MILPAPSGGPPAPGQEPGRRVRTLLVDTNDAVGGIVRGHVMLLRRLDRARFDVHVACLGHGQLLPEFRAVPDATVWTIEPGTKPVTHCGGWRGRLHDALSVLPLARAALRLARQCRAAGIQVVHTSDKRRAIDLVLLLRRLGGPPFLYHIHDHYVDHLANRLALGRARLIIANSGDMRRDFLERRGPAMERIRVVHNGTDAARFSPGPRDDGLRRACGAAPEEVLVGITSRLAPDKGHDTFLRAAAGLLAVEPRARFVVVGDESVYSANAGMAARLAALAGELGLAGRVHFAGFRDDMPLVYRGLDVVVNAAWREAFGMVVVEAMACGRPVVGTAAGGVPEIITPGRDGFLVPPGDAGALAAALLPLVRDPDLRARTGAAARETVLARFSLEAYAAAIGRLYEEIAAAPGGRDPPPAAARR